jgi:carboxyl-terminal processing protease
MKQRILLLLLFISVNIQAQKFDSLRQESRALTQLILKKHFNNPKVDDIFSEQLFEQFIRKIDKKGLIFTQLEIKDLECFKTQLDNELTGESWAFVPAFSQAYMRAIERVIRIVEEVSKEPLNFSEDEFIQFSKMKKPSFVTDEAALKNRWRKWFKLKVLDAAYSKASTTENLSSLEPKMRQNVAQKYLKIFKKEADLSKKTAYRHIYDTFLETLSLTFDPHTVYLANDDLDNFLNQVSSDDQSFGLIISQDDKGDFIIAYLIPGGSAWRTNELNKKDIILKLKTDDGETHESNSMDFEEMEELIEAGKSKKIELTIQKPNGTIKVVSLEKSTIEDTEDVVKGYVLEGKKRIGYISLPDFYSGWDEYSGSAKGCANDLAKQIVKLKQEGIEGLILDVRNNGGGSMQEGLDLSGIFIDQGLLGMAKYQDKKVISMKDQNRGTIYDGPMILMANGSSASASELLAGILQDYNRALIVGNKTFGKGTIQVLMPVDTGVRYGRKKYSFEMGSVLLTIGRFYRPNGVSSQIKGITPDVQIPDFLDKIIDREDKYPNAFLADSVSKKLNISILSQISVESLRQKSLVRIEKSRYFTDIKSLEKQWENLPDKVMLNWTDYRAFYNIEKNIMAQFNKQTDDIKSSIFTVKNTKSDQEFMKTDAFTKEMNAMVLKNLNADFELEESYQIMMDMISK